MILTAREEGEASVETLLEIPSEEAEEELVKEGEGACETTETAHELFLGSENFKKDLNDGFLDTPFSFTLQDHNYETCISSYSSTFQEILWYTFELIPKTALIMFT